MKQEILLQLLYQFGFHSLNKEPFLYDGKLGTGFVYTYKDSYYGLLTRLYTPKNEEDAEDFLRKYYWYRKLGIKYNVDLALDKYDNVNPNVTYLKDNISLDSNALKGLPTAKPKETPKEEKNTQYIEQEKRASLILLKMIAEKMKVQTTTYANLITYKKELNEQQYHLNILIHNLIKVGDTPVLQEESFKKMKEDHPILHQIESQVKRLDDVQDLAKIIQTLTDFLYKLESNEDFIQNKYDLISLPIKIDNIKKKIELLTSIPIKDKSKYKTMSKIDELLNGVTDDDLKDVPDYNQFKEKEIQKLKDKYAMVPNLDARAVGDFFMEYDNIPIDIPPIADDEPKETEYSYENTMKLLEDNYAKRDNSEKNILILFHSILNNIRNNMNQDIVKDLIKDFIHIINNENNILIKVKYFKNIDTSSVNNCLKDLSTTWNKITNILPEDMVSDINVFFKDQKEFTPNNYLMVSNKRSLAPCQYLEENPITYIGLLKSGVPVYFIPVAIEYDLESEDTLIEKDQVPYFLIDHQKINIQINSDILQVHNYDIVKEKKENYTLITDMKDTGYRQYQKVIIERK